jgi:exopolyphosphatase/guanosine-5'-triphosphate,3'-diphosphate pyrophosphatase
MLHDVGTFVSYKGHHKHSLYLILNSDLFGLGSEDVVLAALTARYHRRAVPQPAHEVYATLDRAGRIKVQKLAAILRVADALDRQHRGLVRSLRAAIGEREVTLTVEAAGDLSVERWSLARKANLFAEAFGRQVRLEGNGEKK